MEVTARFARALRELVLVAPIRLGAGRALAVRTCGLMVSRRALSAERGALSCAVFATGTGAAVGEIKHCFEFADRAGKERVGCDVGK